MQINRRRFSYLYLLLLVCRMTSHSLIASAKKVSASFGVVSSSWKMDVLVNHHFLLTVKSSGIKILIDLTSGGEIRGLIRLINNSKVHLGTCGKLHVCDLSGSFNYSDSMM